MSKQFMDQDFLLKTDTARHLFHDIADGLPIIDYHCHLVPQQIAEDKRFENITEAWLGGDHYKWRLMRLQGIDERLITGDADPREKFRAYAEALEKAVGNQLYHWTHLEMQRFFGIYEPLTVANADSLYDKMNAELAREGFSARGFISRSGVRQICTTDDPVDSLCWHKAIAADPIPGCTVRPTFRPDRAVLIERDGFQDYMRQLEKVSGVSTATLDGVLGALAARIDFFDAAGCRLSDHDFGSVPTRFPSQSEAEAIYQKRMNGGELTAAEEDGYKGFVILRLAKLFCEHNWTMQLHLASMRNNNSRQFAALGRDTGYDVMSDGSVAFALSRLLDKMDSDNALPRTVLYSLNSKDNIPLISLCGCFTAPGVRGKVQFGSAWWFLDNKDGMEQQMRQTASTNLLSVFVGMLTDSRSFLSYPRHEYFRRIFCNLLGDWVEAGEYPADERLLREIVEGVCYKNAEAYFGF